MDRGNPNFKKGHKKKGGRKKGTANKATATLKELLAEKYPDYNPVVAMAEMAQDEKNTVTVRLAAHREVAKYTNHQLKAIEITGEIDGPKVVQTYKLANGTEITFG